tara:strand:- start:2266 stop:2595 length:330 start_codon:yes stop_codon:yes gene_type:complete
MVDISEKIAAHNARLERLRVDVPELDLVFYIKPPTYAVTAKYAKGIQSDVFALMPKILVEQAVDEQGKRIFTAANLPDLKNAHISIMAPIMEKVIPFLTGAEAGDLGES